MISIHIAEALWREGTSKPPGNASLESTAKTLISPSFLSQLSHRIDALFIEDSNVLSCVTYFPTHILSESRLPDMGREI
jgi:hypothetical protein